jgi:hypothetical protein
MSDDPMLDNLYPTLTKKLDKMTNEDIVKLIDSNKELMKEMVGSLYPDILRSENYQAEKYLREKRNYSYFMGKSYGELK